MFIPNPSSKQKRVKKTQEHENRQSANNSSPGELRYSLWRARVLTTSPGEKGHSPGRAKNR